jgi:hypothetical protein
MQWAIISAPGFDRDTAQPGAGIARFAGSCLPRQ